MTKKHEPLMPITTIISIVVIGLCVSCLKNFDTFNKDESKFKEPDKLNIIGESAKQNPTPLPQENFDSIAKRLYKEAYWAADMGEYQKAMTKIQSSISYNSDDVDAYYVRGLLHKELHQYKESISDFTYFLKFRENDIDALWNRSSAKFELHDYYGTIDDLNLILELGRQSNQLYTLRAAARIALQDYVNAETDLELAFQLNADFAKSYYYRGQLYLRTGRVEDGCRDLSKSGQLGYTDAYDVIARECGRKF